MVKLGEMREMPVPPAMLSARQFPSLSKERLPRPKGSPASAGGKMMKNVVKIEDMPEPVKLALRAQTNQVEQMASFMVSTLSFSFFVNGMVGGIRGLLWVTLRMMYTSTYRASVGVNWDKKGLGTYTIPCYFLLNSMASATALHMLRYAAGRYMA